MASPIVPSAVLPPGLCVFVLIESLTWATPTTQRYSLLAINENLMGSILPVLVLLSTLRVRFDEAKEKFDTVCVESDS